MSDKPKPSPLEHNAHVLSRALCERLQPQIETVLAPIIQKTTDELLRKGKPVPINQALSAGAGFGVWVGVKLAVESLLGMAVSGSLADCGRNYIDQTTLEITIEPTPVDLSAAVPADGSDRGASQTIETDQPVTGLDVPGVAVAPVDVSESPATELG